MNELGYHANVSSYGPISFRKINEHVIPNDFPYGIFLFSWLPIKKLLQEKSTKYSLHSFSGSISF